MRREKGVQETTAAPLVHGPRRLSLRVATDGHSWEGKGLGKKTEQNEAQGRGKEAKIWNDDEENHRIPERSGLEGPSVGHPVQPPAKAGSPRAGCTAPRPGRTGISPEKETPQLPWAAWARAPSPSE